MPKEAREMLGITSASIAWIQWAGGLIFWNVIALIGFWRGRKIQLRRYADYLLKKVTPDIRITVLSLLRDEVAAISNNPGQSPAGTGAQAPPLPA